MKRNNAFSFATSKFLCNSLFSTLGYKDCVRIVKNGKVVSTMTWEQASVLTNVAQYLSESDLEIQGVYLYGSLSRGEGRTASDVDVFVVTEGVVPFHKVREVRIEDFSVGNVDADIHFETEENFNASNSVYHRNIKREGLLLWHA